MFGDVRSRFVSARNEVRSIYAEGRDSQPNAKPESERRVAEERGGEGLPRNYF